MALPALLKKDEGMNTRLGIRIALVVIIVATVGCDRVTKHVATSTLAGTAGHSLFADTVRLAYVENAGGFLSLGADLPPAIRTAIFTVATGMVLLGVAGVAVRFRWRGWPALGIALFFSGGLSNWYDRAMRGLVVDFLTIGVGPVRTGIFNVADVAIVLGAGIFVLSELRRGKTRTFSDDCAGAP